MFISLKYTLTNPGPSEWYFLPSCTKQAGFQAERHITRSPREPVRQSENRMNAKYYNASIQVEGSFVCCTCSWCNLDTSAAMDEIRVKATKDFCRIFSDTPFSSQVSCMSESNLAPCRSNDESS